MPCQYMVRALGSAPGVSGKFLTSTQPRSVRWSMWVSIHSLTLIGMACVLKYKLVPFKATVFFHLEATINSLGTCGQSAVCACRCAFIHVSLLDPRDRPQHLVHGGHHHGISGHLTTPLSTELCMAHECFHDPGLMSSIAGPGDCSMTINQGKQHRVGPGSHIKNGDEGPAGLGPQWR